MEMFEGDILVGSSDILSAHLADPDKLWPSGVVEYKFYKTFPRCVDIKIVQKVI